MVMCGAGSLGWLWTPLVPPRLRVTAAGLVYRALGFPPQFFTVLFAVPRVTGYLSHWKESLTDPDTKILRPQQDYRVSRVFQGLFLEVGFESHHQDAVWGFCFSLEWCSCQSCQIYWDM